MIKMSVFNKINDNLIVDTFKNVDHALTTVVTSRFGLVGVPVYGGYNTPDTVVKHRRRKWVMK